MLFEIVPRLVFPADADDYFATEQVATWNVEAFWGLPHHPQTPYYRTFETVVRAEAHQYDAKAHLYEFVVPMVPPSWNEPERVAIWVAISCVSAVATNSNPISRGAAGSSTVSPDTAFQP